MWPFEGNRGADVTLSKNEFDTPVLRDVWECRSRFLWYYYYYLFKCVFVCARTHAIQKKAHSSTPLTCTSGFAVEEVNVPFFCTLHTTIKTQQNSLCWRSTRLQNKRSTSKSSSCILQHEEHFLCWRCLNVSKSIVTLRDTQHFQIHFAQIQNQTATMRQKHMIRHKSETQPPRAALTNHTRPAHAASCTTMAAVEEQSLAAAAAAAAVSFLHKWSRFYS